MGRLLLLCCREKLQSELSGPSDSLAGSLHCILYTQVIVSVLSSWTSISTKPIGDDGTCFRYNIYYFPPGCLHFEVVRIEDDKRRTCHSHWMCLFDTGRNSLNKSSLLSCEVAGEEGELITSGGRVPPAELDLNPSLLVWQLLPVTIGEERLGSVHNKIHTAHSPKNPRGLKII